MSRHEYFHLEFSWCRDWPFVSGPMLKVVEYLDVFDYLKTLVRSEDLFVFLRDWYMTEWLVYDFGEAARWAEKALTADDYERLFNPAVVADPPADAGREEEDE